MRGLALVLVAGCASSPAPQPPAQAAANLDSTAIEDRFFVDGKLADGQKVRFFTDSGGGSIFVFKDRALALGLPAEKIKETGEDGQALEMTHLVFAPGAAIPMPPATRVLIFDGPHMSDEPCDGLLGQTWFAGHVWTFDYPGKKLLLVDALPPHDPAHEVELGFLVDAAGKRQTDFPRIQAEIDGETIDFLFDTGATVKMKPDAHAAIADGKPAERAASFIIQSRFQAWRKRHPDWRVVEEADANVGGEPMILVPVVRVAGYEAHDVWFTARENPNFHQFMSQWMDKKIDGALGGSAYRAFRVSVDYPRARAVFEKP